jgi:hypothetical protein
MWVGKRNVTGPTKVRDCHVLDDSMKIHKSFVIILSTFLLGINVTAEILVI